jgi:hypothetical protein
MAEANVTVQAAHLTDGEVMNFEKRRHKVGSSRREVITLQFEKIKTEPPVCEMVRR